jgi:hypothetical protein
MVERGGMCVTSVRYISGWLSPKHTRDHSPSVCPHPPLLSVPTVLRYTINCNVVLLVTPMRHAKIIKQSQLNITRTRTSYESKFRSVRTDYRRLVYLSTLSQLQGLYTVVRKHVAEHGRGLFNAP